MGNILTYKGFTTKILIDLDDDVIYGKIEGIDDLVVFEGDTVPEIKAAFYAAVDDYIDFKKTLKSKD